MNPVSIGDYYNASALYKNTGELTGKILQETFASNPNVYDVIVVTLIFLVIHL
jgi:hypothetical protein